MRIANVPPPGGGNLGLVPFDNTGFRGRSYTVTGVTPELSSFMNRAEGVRVDGGVWELCEWPQFGGRCVNVSSRLSDLRSVGLLNRVASVRPAIMPPCRDNGPAQDTLPACAGSSRSASQS